MASVTAKSLTSRTRICRIDCSQSINPCRETGNLAKAKDWLPKEKQYLITRKGMYSTGQMRVLCFVAAQRTQQSGHTLAWLAVPSNKRASEVEQYGEKAEASSMLEEGGDEEGWVAPPMQTQRHEAEEISSLQPTPEGHNSDPAEEEDDIPDIDELELEDHEIDEVRSPDVLFSPGAGLQSFLMACCSKHHVPV